MTNLGRMALAPVLLVLAGNQQLAAQEISLYTHEYTNKSLPKDRVRQVYSGPYVMMKLCAKDGEVAVAIKKPKAALDLPYFIDAGTCVFRGAEIVQFLGGDGNLILTVLPNVNNHSSPY